MNLAYRYARLVFILIQLRFHSPNQAVDALFGDDTIELRSIVLENADVIGDDVVSAPSVTLRTQAVVDPDLDGTTAALGLDGGLDHDIVALLFLAVVYDLVAEVGSELRDIIALHDQSQSVDQRIALRRRHLLPMVDERPFGEVPDIEEIPQLVRDLRGVLPFSVAPALHLSGQ